MDFKQTSTRFIFGIIFATLCFVAALLFARSFQSSGNTVDTSRAAVVQKIQSLGNLETTSFTIDLLLSSNAFLARILDNEKAEILGSSVLKTGVIGVAITGFSTVASVF